MIRVVGNEGTEEYVAACQLRDLIASSWPGAVMSPTVIHLVANVKCINQPLSDVDIVAFFPSLPPRKILWEDCATTCEFSQVCVAIEVKSHSPDRIKFTGNQVDVFYANRPFPRNASHQSHLQGISVSGHLKDEGYKGWCTNLLWLTSYPSSLLPKQQHNILASDATWDSFMDVLVANNLSYLRTLSTGHRLLQHYKMYPEAFQRAAGVFSTVMQASNIDRRRMEAISQSFLTNQQYIDQLGNTLIIFKGRGGTGKTMRLLRLAYDLYQNRDAQVLILTYNKALVADINRLLTLMGVRTSNAEHCVKIRTIYSYLREVMQGFNFPVETDYLARYEEHKANLLTIVRGASPEEVRMLAPHNNNTLQWDYIFIDEAQDWPADERDIMYALHGHERFVLADGVDQLVRSSARIDWREHLPKKATKIVPLTRTLRLKAGLCKFINAVADRLGVADWKLVPNEEAYGGRVVVLQGDWGAYCRNRSVHDSLLEQNRKDGNSNVDALFCVHAKLTGTHEGQKYSLAGSMFKNWDYESWDGVNEDIRDKCPTKLEQLRILQYDSCRGLEGWLVVAFELDRFFDQQVNRFTPAKQEEEAPFYDAQQAAQSFAKQWVLIPLTRAIDTLVIQITSVDTYIGQVVQAAAKACGDLVEWRVLP